MKYIDQSRKHNGFTLIEVMLVIVLIGLMMSIVQFSNSNDQQENLLKQSSVKFAGVFELAAEYGMLNNLELGLVVDKTQYQFVGFDGTRWTEVSASDVLTTFELPEGVQVELELDDLPYEEPALYDRSTFDIQDEDDDEDYSRREEEDDEEGEEVKKIIPQVYILSGGDITPFKLIFSLEDQIFGEQSISYQVLGSYSVPLTIEGPIEQ